ITSSCPRARDGRGSVSATLSPQALVSTQLFLPEEANPTRSQALLGNAVFAALRQDLRRDGEGRGASGTAFPSRAWERGNPAPARSKRHCVDTIAPQERVAAPRPGGAPVK